MRFLYEIVQVLALILWLPALAVTEIARLVSRAARTVGDALFRPIYWGVVQAKRRRLGLPLWQPHDFQIGIGPPCEHCGENVPPGRHRKDCAFVMSGPPPD